VGIKLAGIDVSGIINEEIGNKVLTDAAAHDAILHIVAGGARTGNLTGGTNPSETDKTCKGFIDSKDHERIGGTLVEDGDVVVVLIGDSIQDAAVPEVKDKVTIEGDKYNVKALDRDPAAATYTLLCKTL